MAFKQPVVTIRQVSSNSWELISLQSDGKVAVLNDNLTLWSEKAAEEYIRAYISSFMCWTYVVEPLQRSKK